MTSEPVSEKQRRAFRVLVVQPGVGHKLVQRLGAQGCLLVFETVRIPCLPDTPTARMALDGAGEIVDVLQDLR
jgi:hypothetical protein